MRREGGGGEKTREQNHLVKHLTVRSSSDLSTRLLSSDNWKVASVCTEPRETEDIFWQSLTGQTVAAGEEQEDVGGGAAGFNMDAYEHLSVFLFSRSFRVASLQQREQQAAGKGHGLIVSCNCLRVPSDPDVLRGTLQKNLCSGTFGSDVDARTTRRSSW